MSNLTLNDISIAVLFLVGLIGGISYLHNSLKKYLTKILEDQFKGLRSDIKEIKDDLIKVDIETTKNFIVRYLADVERGEYIAEVEKLRFWEEYKHYLDKDGNSYVKEWIDRLKKEGKL